MLKAEIGRFFRINLKSRKPLHLQLSDRIERFIQLNKPGSKMPPERKIAEVLKISRNTVRKSLDKFVVTGLLERNLNGTFIARNHPEARLTDSGHSMNFERIQFLTENQVIHFSLYEDLPQQKYFWEKMVKDFNQSQFQSRIEIDWVPHEVNKNLPYDVYLQETNPDIFLLPSTQVPRIIKSNLLSAVPDKLQNQLLTDAYWQHLYYLQDIIPTYMVPVHFSNWGIFWNQDLVERYGLEDVRQQLINKRLAPLFNCAAERIRSGMTVSGRVWNCLASLGFPYDESNIDSLKKYFIERFEWLASNFAGKRKVFLTNQRSPLESLELFRDQKMIFYIGNSAFIFLQTGTINFKLNVMWLSTPDTHYLPTSFSSLGVNIKSLKKSTAWKFVEMIVSDPAQQLLTREKINCSVLKHANKNFNDAFPEAYLEELNASIQSLSSQLDSSNVLPRTVIFENRDIYKQIIDYQLSPETAASKVIENLRGNNNDDKI